MKTHYKTFRLFLSVVLLGLTILVYQMVVMGSETAVASPSAEADWTIPIPITTSLNEEFGANFPIVKASPDGHTVMVVFNRARSLVEGNNDPYFSRSLNNGETWSAPTPILNSVALSGQIDMDYDANGVAHVAWKEGTGLAYANEGTANSGNWTNPFKELVTTGSNPGVTTPKIIASENNLVDIVWSEGSGAGLNIYHARSRDGGNNWPIQAIVKSTPSSSQFPSVAVDSSGIIHLVWQDPDHLLFNPPRVGGTIYYVQGIEGAGNTISWSNPIAITTVDDAREPEIIVNGNWLGVVYTDFINKDIQSVRYLQCFSNCTQVANWLVEPSPISGQFSGANGADPLNVVASLIRRGQCSIVYFHGTAEGLTDNEIIWGVNSCDGWSQSPRDQVTFDNVRSINPNLEVQNNWWLYLAYEQGSGDIRQIYLHRAKPDVYLPVTLK